MGPSRFLAWHCLLCNQACAENKKETSSAKLLDERLQGAPEEITRIQDHWEGFQEWEFANLREIKKAFGADIGKVNSYLLSIKALGPPK